MSETYINVSIRLTKHGVTQVPELTARRLGTRSGPLDSVKSLLEKIGSGAYRGNVAVLVADDTGTQPTHTIQVTAFASAADELVTVAIPGGAVSLTEGIDFTAETSDEVTAAALHAELILNADIVKVYDVTVATDTVTFTPRFGHFDEPSAAVAITAGAGMTATNLATGAPTTARYATFDNID